MTRVKCNLGRILDDLELKGKDLAQRSGVSVTTISRLKQKKYPPAVDLEVIAKLCNALSCAYQDSGKDLSPQDVLTLLLQIERED